MNDKNTAILVGIIGAILIIVIVIVIVYAFTGFGIKPSPPPPPPNTAATQVVNMGTPPTVAAVLAGQSKPTVTVSTTTGNTTVAVTTSAPVNQGRPAGSVCMVDADCGGGLVCSDAIPYNINSMTPWSDVVPIGRSVVDTTFDGTTTVVLSKSVNPQAQYIALISPDGTRREQQLPASIPPLVQVAFFNNALWALGADGNIYTDLFTSPKQIAHTTKFRQLVTNGTVLAMVDSNNQVILTDTTGKSVTSTIPAGAYVRLNGNTYAVFTPTSDAKDMIIYQDQIHTIPGSSGSIDRFVNTAMGPMFLNTKVCAATSRPSLS